MSVTVSGTKIFFVGDIDDASAQQFIWCLGEVELADRIELHISSPGGSIHATRRMTDAIENFPLPVTGVVCKTPIFDGVASAAAILTSQLAGCWIQKDATFMVHFGTCGARNEDVEYWMLKTGLDYDCISDLMLNEYDMTAEEAVEMNFVDGIV